MDFSPLQLLNGKFKDGCLVIDGSRNEDGIREIGLQKQIEIDESQK